MNLLQKAYKYLRLRAILNSLKGVPIINLILFPQFNRFAISRILLTFGVLVPIIGLARRNYIKKKYFNYLQSKKQSGQLQIKQQIAKFDIKLPKNIEYMIIINLEEQISKQSEEIIGIDKQNTIKVYNLIEEAQNTMQSSLIKWTFLGSKKLFEAIENSRTNVQTKNQKVQVEFYESQKQKKQIKIYLIALDSQGQQKIIMDWSKGVTFKQISQYIAKHKYNRYLKQVNF